MKKLIKPEKLYRYYPLDPSNKKFMKRILHILRNHSLFATSPREFNDPFDCIVKLEMSDQRREKEIQSRVNQHAGVVSFSENKDHILMWAHYANKHLGVCLEFDLNRWKDMPVHWDKIDYLMKRPLLTLSQDEQDSVGILRKMAFAKHKDWKYEKEWRIICSFKDPSERYLIFPKEILTGIIFGLKTSHDDRKRILKTVNTSDFGIKFYKAIENKTQFKVKIIPFDQ